MTPQLLPLTVGEASSDAELLCQFVSSRHDAAFLQLMTRHGSLVWGVCQRLRLSPVDSEDVFQATFLVLFQEAARIRQRECLASWLYGIAWRIGNRIKRTASRERCRQQRTARSEMVHDSETVDNEILQCLDWELLKLPGYYRDPLILCYLQGNTQTQAAKILGWPVGTVAGRLSRAKAILRARLLERGVLPALVISMLAGSRVSAVPPSLVETIGHTILLGSPTAIVLLAQGVFPMISTFRIAALLICSITVLGLCYASPLHQQEVPPTKPATLSKVEKPQPSDMERLQGRWMRTVPHEVTGVNIAAEDLEFRGNSYIRHYQIIDTDGTYMRTSSKASAEKEFKMNTQEKRIELIDYSLDSLRLNNNKSHPDWPTKLVERYVAKYEVSEDTLKITFDQKVCYVKDDKGNAIPGKQIEAVQRQPQLTFYRYHGNELGDRISDLLQQGEVATSLLQDTIPQLAFRYGDRVDVESTIKKEDGSTEVKAILENVEVLHSGKTAYQGKERLQVILRLTRAQNEMLQYHRNRYPTAAKKRNP